MKQRPGRGRDGDEASAGERVRGLPSIAEARRARGRTSWLPPKFWAWAAVVLAATFIYWWKKEEGEIQSMRSELLARQRAVVAELGPRWFPLRDKIESWTSQCARFTDEQVDAEGLRGWDFRSKPGIYLRLGQQQTGSPEAIRTAARRSLHDGFTACLLRVPNANPVEGPACKSNKDCPPRQHCNEFDHCAEYAQPYNLRLAYKVMWILTDEWVDEINSISKELTMRGAVATFDDWNKYDITVAADLLTRARYFMVVVDEPAPGDAAGAAVGGGPAASEDVAHRLAEEKGEVFRGGPAEPLEINRSIPTAPHPARVCLWRLEDSRRLLAVRREAAGRMLGGTPELEPRALEARQRQANACALALEVREAIGDSTGTATPK